MQKKVDVTFSDSPQNQFRIWLADGQRSNIYCIGLPWDGLQPVEHAYDGVNPVLHNWCGDEHRTSPPAAAKQGEAADAGERQAAGLGNGEAGAG